MGQQGLRSGGEEDGAKEVAHRGDFYRSLPRVCLALAREAGHDVYAVLDASGTWNKLVEEAAIARMVQAGIVPMTWVGVGTELLVDWRSATGQAHGKLMADYLPFSGNNFVGFLAAKGAK
jgi:hypothetical protein